MTSKSEIYRKRVRSGEHPSQDGVVTPENTKLIAEWMGYLVEILKVKPDYMNTYVPHNKLCVYVKPHKIHMLSYYDLITNADQSREVEKKLIYLGATIDNVDGRYWVRMKAKGIHTAANPFELAIYKAALKEAKK